jgi:HEAT repeat protein
MGAAKLKLIEESLDRIEHSREEHDYAGGLIALVSKLSSMRTWSFRTAFFERVLTTLNEVSRGNRNVWSTAVKLSDQATSEEYVLNGILNDNDIPRVNKLAAIRYIGKKKDLMASVLVREALTSLVITHYDLEVRRTAWLQLCRYQAWNLPHAPAAVGEATNLSREQLKSLRKELIRERGALGPRGSVVSSAEVRDQYERFIPELLTRLANANGERKEIALTLSEIGGAEIALFLTDALRSEIAEKSINEDYQVYLASALANLGGPHAVESLLGTAEEGSERVRLAALSGLESLATAGSIALTEYPEPATITGEEMRHAYLELAERMSALIDHPATPPYVRHKAIELLETVTISLNSATVPAY